MMKSPGMLHVRAILQAARRAVKGAAAAVLVVCAALAGSACGPKAPPASAAPEPRVHGEATFAFIPDPNAPAPDLPENEELISPYPVYIPPPDYPPHAMDRNCGDATVLLRMVIDPRGRIGEIKESPLGPVPEGFCEEEFRAAAEDATRFWEFRPAEWRRLEPGEDVDADGEPDYQRVARRERIPFYVDVQFLFEVVEGEGRVRLVAPGVLAG